MPHDHPPAADAPPPLPWEALERLAAGELEPAEAAALRARIDEDPGLQVAYGQVTALQEGLDALTLHAVPVQLIRGVMERVGPRRRLRWPHIAAGWAAVVLVSIAGWVALAGTPPGMSHGSPPTAWVASVSEPEWLMAAEDGDPIFAPTSSLALLTNRSDDAVAWPWLLGGLLLLGFGLFYALRTHAAAARRGAA